MTEREPERQIVQETDTGAPTSAAHLNITVSPAEVEASSEDEALPKRDADYYAEVRQSVGAGTPTLLLGTSTRSLDRSLARLRAAQRGSKESPPTVGPRMAPSPPAPNDLEVPSARADVMMEIFEADVPPADLDKEIFEVDVPPPELAKPIEVQYKSDSVIAKLANLLKSSRRSR
jgi:hypothetical protein